MAFSIKARTSIYHAYSTGQDPVRLFDKATQFLDSIRSISKPTAEQEEARAAAVEDLKTRAIFGSNQIERVGLGREATFHLCRQVFRDPEVVEDVEDQSLEHASEVQNLVELEPSLKGQSLQHVLRGRREVIQHAKAFQHIVHRFAVLKEDMSEQLVKNTHAILCNGISIIDEDLPEVPWEQYAGVYRQVPVGAGSTMFVVPKFVPAKMTEMCLKLKHDMDDAERKEEIDPFSLGAKYSLNFVEIHPFQDGNGRLCRMILNAIVFRYTGAFIPIGELEQDREEYMGIKKRATRDMNGHGEYATFVLQKGSESLHKIKQKLNGKR